MNRGLAHVSGIILIIVNKRSSETTSEPTNTKVLLKSGKPCQSNMIPIDGKPLGIEPFHWSKAARRHMQRCLVAGRLPFIESPVEVVSSLVRSTSCWYTNKLSLCMEDIAEEGSVHVKSHHMIQSTWFETRRSRSV